MLLVRSLSALPLGPQVAFQGVTHQHTWLLPSRVPYGPAPSVEQVKDMWSKQAVHCQVSDLWHGLEQKEDQGPPSYLRNISRRERKSWHSAAGAKAKRTPWVAQKPRGVMVNLSEVLTLQFIERRLKSLLFYRFPFPLSFFFSLFEEETEFPTV